MKTKLLFVFAAIVFIVAFTSCRKKCGIKDSENYDKHGDCIFRFCTDIQINSFPVKKPNGAQWDTTSTGPCDSTCAPDLKLILKRATSYMANTTTAWDFSGNSIQLPIWVDYYGQPWYIQLTRETWTFELVDIDNTTTGSGEVIGVGTFNPLEQGSNGEINVTGTNGVSVTIKYRN